MSQSSLTRHIAELEAYVGVPLFEKSPVRLTVVGKHFLEGTSEILASFDRLVDESRELAGSAKHTLTVAMLDAEGSPSWWMVNDAVSVLRESYPNLEFQMNEDRCYTVVEAVQNEIVDVGVVLYGSESFPDGIAVEHMFDMPYMAWVSRDSAMPDEVPSREAFAGWTLVRSANRRFDDWIDGIVQAYERNGIPIGQRVKNVDTLMGFLNSLKKGEFVFTGIWASFLGADSTRIKMVRFSNADQAVVPVGLVYKTGRSNPMVSTFIEACRLVTQR